MKKKALLRFSGLALLVLGLVLLNLTRDGKNIEKTADLNINDEISQEVSLTSAGIQKPTTNLKELIKKNLAAQEKSVQDLEAQKSLLLKKRIYTEAEIAKMTEAEFNSVLTETEAALPTIHDIRKLPPGALHHVPAPVIQAGRDLGLIKEILSVHPEYVTVANSFYENCAERDDRPQAVRALCLTNLLQNKESLGEKVNLSMYPKEIVELTKLVIDI